MKCRFCDGQVFVGHQVCHLDILVDDSVYFLIICWVPRHPSMKEHTFWTIFGAAGAALSTMN